MKNSIVKKRYKTLSERWISLAIVLFALAACSEKEVPDTVANALELDVYKSETCGCCGAWIEHLEAHGAKVSVHHPQDLSAIKAQFGVGNLYESCHTGVSKQGYVFEGHIPAKYIQQFLAQPPANALGLSVPGMPLGSPGMEMNDRFQPYEIVLMKKDGTYSTYAKIESMEDQY